MKQRFIIAPHLSCRPRGAGKMQDFLASTQIKQKRIAIDLGRARERMPWSERFVGFQLRIHGYSVVIQRRWAIGSLGDERKLGTN